MALNDELFRVAEQAIQSLGRGYDLTNDLDFKYCKWDSRVLVIDEMECSDIEIPGGISIPNVSNTIECVTKKESKRITSGVLSFSQMTEQFNQDASLSGKIPSGLFNAAFGFSGSWQQDASSTKALAFDGMLITLYGFTIKKYMLELHDQVRKAVPKTWDPLAMARFIKKFGTHAVVGVTLGGKDAIYVRQQHSSPLHPDEIYGMLKDITDKRFLDFGQSHSVNTNGVNKDEKLLQNITFICKRKGGSSNTELHHKEWSQTIESKPDIVSVSLHPLGSLLRGLNGIGFVNHAINLYLHYNPNANYSDCSYDSKYYKKVQWSTFAHICTAPVESDDASIVTGAKLEVAKHKGKKVLFLRLQFSTVLGAIVVKQSEWDNSFVLDQVTSKTGNMSTGLSIGQKETLKPGGVTIGSAVYPGGPFTLPTPIHACKVQRYVDTKEISRGPEDTPGYWVVTGARLLVQNSTVCLLVKYSLFNFALPPANDIP